MSDTPRTDDEQYGATGRVSVDFARTLERELTAAQARIAELETELESHAWKISPAMAEARIEQLFAENEQLKKRLTSSERARQSLSDACDSLQAELAKLNDPVAVHINMLRGTIATPNREQMQHVWGGDGLPTPLPRPDKPGWWWQLRGREWLMRCISYRLEGDPGQWIPATPPPAPKNN